MSVSVTPTVQAARGTWEIDPAHSSVEFAVKHMVVTTQKGLFARVNGAIVMDEADPASSSVEAEIEAASIDTRWSDRDAHLRSADFLDVERYPTIVFKSTRVTPRGHDRFDVVGNLTIRGITREVTLDVEYNGRGQDPWGGSRAGFSATASIDRTDFNMTWNSTLEAGGLLVGNQVKIHLDVEAILK